MSHRRNETHTHMLRLKGHNYADPGYYFVTFTTRDRIPFLGTLDDGDLQLTQIGVYTRREILEIPDRFPTVTIDSLAIMPDHVHVLIYLSLANDMVSVSDVVRSVKGRSSTELRRLEPETGGRLWQSGFIDQIIRNDVHLATVRRYIDENPIRPAKDVWW